MPRRFLACAELRSAAAAKAAAYKSSYHFVVQARQNREQIRSPNGRSRAEDCRLRAARQRVKANDTDFKSFR